MATKTFKELEQEALERQRAFKKDLKEFRQNRAKYGVIEEAPGGYFFRLRNSQFSSNSKKSKLSY